MTVRPLFEASRSIGTAAPGEVKELSVTGMHPGTCYGSAVKADSFEKGLIQLEYAMLEFPEGKRLVHKLELESLDYKDSDMEIHRPHSKKLQIIVGIIKLNHHADTSLLDCSSLVGADLAFVTGNRCNIHKVVDIMFIENEDNYTFSALIQGDIMIQKQSIPLFVRANDLSIKDNIIHRSCIFSMIWRNAGGVIVTKENWCEVLAEELEIELENRESERRQLEPIFDLRNRDRDDVINEVLLRDNLYSDIHYTYHLTHTYDNEPRRIVVTSTIEPYTMDLLVAYIQFHACDIDSRHGMDQVEVKRILKELYSGTQQKNNMYTMDPTPCEIDLYVNWEWWCGKSDRVMDCTLFQNDRLINLLEEIIR